jgi:hypothetical protein
MKLIAAEANPKLSESMDKELNYEHRTNQQAIREAGGDLLA